MLKLKKYRLYELAQMHTYMKNLLTLLLIGLFLTGCNHHEEQSVDIRKKFGPFTSAQTLKWKPVDISKTPIYKTISRHPDQYGYLNDVEIYSIGHISDGLLLSGFMVAPKKEGKYPIIVFNRGGNQELGRLLVATAVEVMAPFAAQGYITIATNYRGNSGGEGKEQFGGSDVDDVINLIRSSGEYPKADTSRVGLFGISRGGMMNFLTLKNSDLPIRAMVNIGGITDLETTIKYHPEIGEVANELIPGFQSNREEAIKNRSAVYWVNKIPKNTPMLLLHSKEDKHVNYSQISVFTDSLDKYNMPYKSISFEHDKHGLINHKEQVRNLVLDWFDRYLKEEQPYNEFFKREVVSD